jgi:hypothetical protein
VAITEPPKIDTSPAKNITHSIAKQESLHTQDRVNMDTNIDVEERKLKRKNLAYLQKNLENA